MHPEDIKAAIRKQGVTLSAIARSQGMHPNSVTNVIAGKQRSPSLAAAIAKIVGQKKEALWPGVYDKPSADDRVKQLLKRAA